MIQPKTSRLPVERATTCKFLFLSRMAVPDLLEPRDPFQTQSHVRHARLSMRGIYLVGVL